MKSKRILVTYLDNGDFKNIVAKEAMFNKVLKELISEGKEIEFQIHKGKCKRVVFLDGSRLDLSPINISFRGSRITHIFADKELEKLSVNGVNLLNEVIYPHLIVGDYENLDTDGQQVSFYSLEENELRIEAK